MIDTGLLNHASAGMGRIPGVRIVGTARHKASILSFVMDGVQQREDIEGLLHEIKPSGRRPATQLVESTGVASEILVNIQYWVTFEALCESLARSDLVDCARRWPPPASADRDWPSNYGMILAT